MYLLFSFVLYQLLIAIFLFHGRMKITLKHAKKQKVKKYLASNNFYVIHQQYLRLIEITSIKTTIFICPWLKKDYLVFSMQLIMNKKSSLLITVSANFHLHMKIILVLSFCISAVRKKTHCKIILNLIFFLYGYTSTDYNDNISRV